MILIIAEELEKLKKLITLKNELMWDEIVRLMEKK